MKHSVKVQGRDPDTHIWKTHELTFDVVEPIKETVDRWCVNEFDGWPCNVISIKEIK